MSNVTPNVVIVDYGMGNIVSVKSACEYAGLNSFTSTNPNDLYTRISQIRYYIQLESHAAKINI